MVPGSTSEPSKKPPRAGSIPSRALLFVKLRARSWLCVLALLGCMALTANGKSMPEGTQASEEGAPPNSAATALGPLATVHGIVKDASTGEPLPRALVLVNGQS